MKLAAFGIILLLVLLVLLPLFVWFGCRIEPGNGEIAVLIRKTGKPLPPDELIARSPEQQGIQLEVLGEGRYFRNPYTWDWEILPITDVPAGKFAVLVRKFGRDLTDGRIIAPDDESKGVLADVLGTGKHRINPYAYEVRIYDDVRIMPGFIGGDFRLRRGRFQRRPQRKRLSARISGQTRTQGCAGRRAEGGDASHQSVYLQRRSGQHPEPAA